MKIPKLLAFSLALSLTPVCAAAEVQPPQAAAEAKTAAEEILSHEPAEESAGEVPTHYSLNFDKEAFRKETAEVAGLPINFRVYENCRYTAYPAASEKEQLSIYVPEEYFSKKEVIFNSSPEQVDFYISKGARVNDSQKFWNYEDDCEEEVTFLDLTIEDSRYSAENVKSVIDAGGKFAYGVVDVDSLFDKYGMM